MQKLFLFNYKPNHTLSWHSPVILFIVLLALYIWSAPRTVVLGDDGYFILVSYFNGVAHPPGYPLYTLFGKLATNIPCGEIAFRVHVLSGIFGAFTCLTIWYITRHLVGPSVYAYAAAVCYGISPLFWSQSIIAEVYTLNTFLFFLLLIAILKYSANPGSRWLLNVIALLYGLGISNHWPLLVLSTPALLCLLWPARKVVIKNGFSPVLFFILGLTPYLWMVFSSKLDSAMSFYGPINNWSDFWFYVSRQAYADVDYSPGSDIFDKLHFSIFTINETVRQYGIAGSIFLLIGFIRQWRVWTMPVSLALFSGYFFNTFVLIMLLGFDYDEVHRSVFQVYPLIAYGICSLWLALGIHTVVNFLLQNNKMKTGEIFIATGFNVLIAGMIITTSLPLNYRSKDDWAWNFANTILEHLPRDSIFIGASDYVIGPLGYVHLIEGKRNDLNLYNYTGQLFPNRLFKPGRTDWTEVNRIYNRLISETKKPVYYANYLPHEFGNEHYGLYSKVLKNRPSDFIRAYADPVLMNYFDKMINLGMPVDQSEQLHYKALTFNFCTLLINVLENSSRNNNSYEELYSRGCNNFYGTLAKLAFLIPELDADNQRRINDLLMEADKRKYQSALIKNDALLDFYWGEYYLYIGEKEKADQYYNRSFDKWPERDNPVTKYTN